MGVTSEMKTHLQGTTSLAVFVKITAKDGDVVAVTNCTRNKIVDGITYFAVPLSPSRLQTTKGLKPDNLEMLTVLGGLFTEATLLKRKWLGSRVEYRVLNYKDFTMGHAERRVGFLGATEVGRFTGTPEMLSLSSKLAEPVGGSYNIECDVVELGDTRCGFDLAGNTVDGYRATIPAHVTAVLNRQQFTVAFNQTIKPSDGSVLLAPDKFYLKGKALFTSGANDGATARIYTNAGNGLTLFLPAFYDIAVNDTLTLTVGCDRTIQQCVARFARGISNRSYFMIPGRSKLLKIPE